MSAFSQWLELSWVQALGWTLLHFLWQGALIGLVGSLLFRIANRWTAQGRYLLACTLLGLCVAVPVLTFAILMKPGVVTSSGMILNQTSDAHVVAATTTIAATDGKVVGAVDVSKAKTGNEAVVSPARTSLGSLFSWRAVRDGAVHWVVPFWLVGVVMMGLRLGSAWVRIQRWRFMATAVIDAEVQRLFSRLCEEMKLGRRVRLLLSDRINVPLTLGWLRPVVLLPVQVVTGLSTDELRAVLAHELAHVARYDYLVNLFQSIVEVTLFYHPAVWWLSGKIREAREECCDEAVLELGADRVAYAQALAELAELSLAPEPALGATGGSLFDRIARVLGKPRPEPAWNRSHAAWMLSLAVAFLMILTVFHSAKAAAAPAGGEKVVKKPDAVVPAKPKTDPEVEVFRDAVLSGKLAEAKRQLDQGLDLKKDPKRFGDLFIEASQGDLKMLQLLLDHGMDINTRRDDGTNALGFIVQQGLPNVEESSRFLIEHGIDINNVNNDGITAAWEAAFFVKSPAVLELLREKGARFTGRNKAGATIFTYMMRYVPWSSKVRYEKVSAVELRKYDEKERQTVKTLIAGGADLNELDSWLNETPLICALEGEHYEIARELLNVGADVHKTDNKGNAPILFAMLRSWDLPVPVDLIKRMLALGADPNSRSHGKAVMGVLPEVSTSGLELLFENYDGVWGKGPGANEAVALLLDHGATFAGNPSGADNELLRAAARGDLVKLKAAVSKGAMIDFADADGWTALTVALALGHEDCVAWLLKSGATAKGKTVQGYSPLYFAVVRQQVERVNDFLKQGADPNCGRSADGSVLDYGSALWRAASTKNLPILKALIAAGAKPDEAIVREAIQENQVEMVRLALEKGAPPEAKEPYENRGAAYWAVYYGQPEILKLVLAHGADPERKTAYNETPLSSAQRSNKGMVPILEEAIKQRHQGSIPLQAGTH